METIKIEGVEVTFDKKNMKMTYDLDGHAYSHTWEDSRTLDMEKLTACARNNIFIKYDKRFKK